MRRILVVLLLAILPIQFSWAAAASYCQHEGSGAAAKHFGHHEHSHGSTHADKAKADGGKLTVDDDCAYCQLGCAKPVSTTAPEFAVDTLSSIAQAWPSASYKSHIPSGLDRPDRRIA